ncbi:hypothetical protein HDU81_009326 [Chytriomyces hyalinus]|nr:hypothetical protein HDU81_009326 [Chytriomyces hyalinus]
MGQNQINKVRKNLTKGNRDKKRAFKRSTNTHPVSHVEHVNALVEARNNGDEEEEFGANIVFRRARLGKNNSFIRPTEMSKKKLHKIAHAAKIEKARLIAAGVLDADMDGDAELTAPKSKRRSATARKLMLEFNTKSVEPEQDVTMQVVAGDGKGTTLGKPGVMF